MAKPKRVKPEKRRVQSDEAEFCLAVVRGYSSAVSLPGNNYDVVIEAEAVLLRYLKQM